MPIGEYGSAIEHKITIRFDGLDAEEHEIDLFTLGESMQGIARIAVTVGHFVATQEYSRYFRSHELKVLAKEPRQNCFSIDVVFEFIKQHQMLAGTFPAAVTGLVAWLLHRATKKETPGTDLSSKLLETLRELAGQNAEQTARLHGIMDRMVVDLRPALKQTFAPVGISCRTLTIITPQRSDTFDETDKAALLLPINDEITDLQDWVVLITELDLERGTCKTRLLLVPEERRINAVITDPLLNNSTISTLWRWRLASHCLFEQRHMFKTAQSSDCTFQMLASNNSFKPKPLRNPTNRVILAHPP